RPLIRGFNNTTFVYIKNLIVDPNWPTTLPSSAGLVGVFHSRIENVEIRNVGLMGMDAVGNSEMINMNVHDVGFDKATCTLFGGGTTCYGIYTGSGAGKGENIFDGGRWSNIAGYAVHCYNSCYATVIRN